MIRIHYLQHVPFESPGAILEWAKTSSAPISSTMLHLDEPFPGLDSFDTLVVMGGPMGVHDESAHTWLTREKAFIENAIKADKAVLGICLGAQLIADVLGAAIRKNKDKEIGWFPIETTPENRSIPLTGFLPDSLTVFHWHGETFDIPSSAVRIAGSQGCTNQGFVYGERIVALQFHLEVNPDTLAEMVNNGRHELVAGKYIQNEEAILRNNGHIREMNDYVGRLMKNLSETP